jgi:hypothetical protein
MAKTNQGRIPISKAAQLLGRRGGLASAARLTPEQRHTRARKGGLARAAKRRSREEAAHV